MALPKFTSARKRRNQDTDVVDDKVVDSPRGDMESGVPPTVDRTSSDGTLPVGNAYVPGVDVKRATRTRRNAVIASSFFFFVSVIFLILVEIGDTYNKPVLRNTYFFNLDLSNVLVSSTTLSDITLVNSIARSIGLHDFYTVGLWGFCEGYNNVGTTYCSSPITSYYFNPVQILLNELFAGATITLPSEINDILDLVETISHIMFAFFLTGVCMNFVSIFLAYLPLYTRWWSLPVTIWTFIGALLTVGGSAIATVYAVVLKNALTSQSQLNISASYGVQMWAFMWTASACAVTAFLIQLCLSCCCASKRDVRRGKKKGSLKAYGDVPLSEKEKKPRKFILFGRVQKHVV